jgi:hypothetical protein
MKNKDRNRIETLEKEMAVMKEMVISLLINPVQASKDWREIKAKQAVNLNK